MRVGESGRVEPTKHGSVVRKLMGRHNRPMTPRGAPDRAPETE